METKDLSIILLNYNTKDLTCKCLRSVFASEINFVYEVIVADNGSSDGSIQMIQQEFPQVILIENKANLGFSKGNNAAMKQAVGRYFLLLNTDTEIKPDALDESVKYLDEHPDVGIVGGKVLLPDGSLDKASRRRFPNPWNSFLRLFGLKKFSDYNIDLPIDQIAEVDAVMGAYLMIRKSITEKIGLLDEDYFMYGEDLDWCWQVKQAGYKVVYYPKAEITHYKYGSSQLIPFQTIQLAHQAMKIFYRKHYATEYNWLFNQFVYLGINLRMYLVMLVNILRKKKTVH
ncbi:MAG: glycosyltransferase family 2 protein [Candidatus Doudnabacteria bacterium]|nr:glycosyltransferase family 2 protein [Candidatus Doudnabacteria bacterium]